MVHRLTPKQLKEPLAVAALQARLGDAHVAPITGLVDRLRAVHGDGVPYLDPRTGGIRARMLLVLKDPGSGAKGSGFLSLENDDQTAFNTLTILRDLKVDYGAIAFWNVIPWPGFGSSLSLSELKRGAAVLNDDLLPSLKSLRSLVFVGREVHKAQRFTKRPAGVEVFYTLHTGAQSLNRDPGRRSEVSEGLREAWNHACA
jgi:hypothetical protein